ASGPAASAAAAGRVGAQRAGGLLPPGGTPAPSARAGVFWEGGAAAFPAPRPALLASRRPAMTLAIEPMRRMEPPSGSTLLPGRVSTEPSTTDASPRSTARTRPGAPELSHRIAPLMEAASLRTISPARALAGAPARTSARLAARLFALGVIGPLDTRSLSR